MARRAARETPDMSGPQAARLPGERLHLHHGPIDLIIGAEGPGREAAYCMAAARFQTLLQELVEELPALRRDVAEGAVLRRAVARAMQAAALPFAPAFITPMAAVAGAVADEICGVMARRGGLRRAYVNNGGDVALFLSPGARFTAALAGVPGGQAGIGHDDPVRGVATSGWGGRSYSLGIADSVTVLAANAAAADAAATLIANAVDLPDHPAVTRRPACDLSPDSDLGARLVTVGVGALTRAEIDAALARGVAAAAGLRERGLIDSALICMKGAVQTVGTLQLKEIAHA